jgi:hypothetical protein
MPSGYPAAIGFQTALIIAPNQRPLNSDFGTKCVGINTTGGYAPISSTRYKGPDTRLRFLSEWRQIAPTAGPPAYGPPSPGGSAPEAIPNHPAFLISSRITRRSVSSSDLSWA